MQSQIFTYQFPQQIEAHVVRNNPEKTTQHNLKLPCNNMNFSHKDGFIFRLSISQILIHVLQFHYHCTFSLHIRFQLIIGEANNGQENPKFHMY